MRKRAVFALVSKTIATLKHGIGGRWWEAGPGSAQGLPLSKLDLHPGASNLSMDLACLHLLGNPVQTCS